MDSSADRLTEEVRQRVEALRHYLREAQAQIELQEVRHERDEFENTVAEQKLGARCVIICLDSLRHTERLASEMELSRLQFKLDKVAQHGVSEG